MKKIYKGLLACLFATALTSHAGVFTNLHNFVSGSTTDGASPNGVLLNPNNGLLYGAAGEGGVSGNGMVFTLATNGSGYISIHDFLGSPDGSTPNELLQVGDVIYGTTYSGGTNNSGTVFRMSTNGSSYVVLRSFTNSPGPQFSQTGLTIGGASLYGVSANGGAFGVGCVFKMDTNGANFAVLHDFTNNPDGSKPLGRLLLNGATLYGTASEGGVNTSGTVFKLSTNGTGYSTIYHFSTAPAATAPYVGLIMSSNLLYGTSTSGGISNVGTVFSLATNGGNFTIIHSFTNSEGLSPQGQLTLRNNNTLYGTTLSRVAGAAGTVFQLGTNGANFSVVKYFTNAVTGANPKGQLALGGNTLYGITIAVGPNGGGTVYGVLLSPIITAQPQNLTVTNGNPASFTVSATDDNAISYQWYLNGSLQPGQTAATINFASANNGNAGTYTVVVSDNSGSVTSSPAVLTVTSFVPSIGTQPQGLTVSNGYPATFTVAASNATGYQWYFNTSTAIAGQTNTTYTIPAVLAGNAGNYSVVVSNNNGAVTSTPAALAVTGTEPLILGQPLNLTVSFGSTTNLTAAVFGQPTLGYKWYSNSTAAYVLNATKLIIITNNPSLSVTASFPGTSYYFFFVTNALGRATSSIASFTVVTAPLITSNPQPATVVAGNLVNFSVSALGASTLRYQWYSNSVNTTIGAALAGQTNATYSFTAITNSNGRFYSVVVTNTFGKATSSPPALLTVSSQPSLTITLQPLGITITNGSSVTFTSAAAGTGPLGYQWLYQNTQLIPGATNTSLTFATANQPGNYSMKATNSTGSVTSNPALLTVIGKPILLSSAFDPASGSFSFNLVDLAGSTNRLLATTNLIAPNAWVAIATNYMATNGTWQYTDLNTARTNVLRLYRFVSP